MLTGKILVVEDECVNAVMIEHQLKKLGYAIAGIASSGEEAVELVEKLKPDLVLMDINLSGDMDGVQAAGMIRGKTAVPIIYLTSASDERTIDRALTTEAHGFILKPVHERELHSALQMALYTSWMEVSVREERLWLSSTLRCVTDAVIAADASGAVKFANRAAERLTGWTETAALGRDLDEVYEAREFGQNARPEFLTEQLMRADQTPAIASRKRLVARHGTETIIEQNASLIMSEDCKIKGVVVVFRPVPPP